MSRHEHVMTTTSRSQSIILQTLILILILSICSSLSSFTTPSSSSSMMLSVSGQYAPAPANCSATSVTNPCIRIGVFYCYTAATCTVIGYSKLIDWYIRRVMVTMGGVFNTTNQGAIPVSFIMTNFSTAASNADVLRGVLANFTGGSNYGVQQVDFVILPPGSAWELAMASLESLAIPSLASNSPLSTLYQCGTTAAALLAQPGCYAVNSRRFQYAHGLSSSGQQYYSPWVGLMKLKKALSIAIVQTNVAFYNTVAAGVVASAADYNIPVTYTKVVPFQTGSTSIADPLVLASVISDLQQIQPDGFVLIVANCVPWIAAMAAANYAPKSMATLLCADSSTAASALGNNLQFVVGSAQWSYLMNGNDYIENADQASWSLFPRIQNNAIIGPASPLQFEAMWQKLMNTKILQPGYPEGAVLAAFEMLEGAIQLAGTSLPSSSTGAPNVNDQLRLYYQSSYYGLISTNRYGINQQKQLVINQVDQGNLLQIISPTSSASADFIYPMPVFSDRVYTRQMLSTSIEYVVIVFMLLCMIFTGGLCVYLFINRNQQVFQAAGLLFYLIMGLGCITAYASVLVWGVENNAASCGARVWIWTLCFHMFVDPLLASSWRISRIFSQKLQTVKLTNTMVGAICMALVTPQLIINIAWTVVAPMTATIVTGDVLRPANTSYTTCSAGDAGVIFAGVTLGYSAALLLAACYLAYKVRRAYRIFNDAKPIAMSMYIFTVTAVIILVIQIALNSQNVQAQKVLFGLRSIGIISAYQSSIALLYFRRILGQENKDKYKGNKSQLEDDSASSDATANGPGTGGIGAARKTAPASGGKIVFAKNAPARSGGNDSNKSGGVAGSSAMGASRNVHVHIQPPGMAASQQMVPASFNQPIGSNGMQILASPSLIEPTGAGAGGDGYASRAQSTKRMASGLVQHSPKSGLGMTNLDSSPSTPKLTAKRGLTANPSIVTGYILTPLPPQIMIPSMADLCAMDVNQLVNLLQQCASHILSIRSQYNRMSSAYTILLGGGTQAMMPTMTEGDHDTLPGTPDRSSRHHPIEGLVQSSQLINSPLLDVNAIASSASPEGVDDGRPPIPSRQASIIAPTLSRPASIHEQPTQVGVRSAHLRGESPVHTMTQQTYE